MKKGLLVFLVFFIQFSVISQITIKGKVLTKSNEILEGASVYLNNTTIGTTTNEKGEFVLTTPIGSYDLVVSFIGFKTVQYKIDSNSNIGFLEFKLNANTNILKEVVIKKTKYDSDWWYNLSQFKQTFLGKTLVASKCKILNPKVLHFEYDKKSKVLTAETNKPLKILNKELGYLIFYDLVHYSLGRKKLSYLGYSRYTKLKGGKSKQRRWKKKRLKAYNGSRMHFVRSLRKQSLKKEGFLVNQFKRVLNPNRPSDEQINKARSIIEKNKEYLKIYNEAPVNTALDSAMIILRKRSLPKYSDYLYKENVPYKDMIKLIKSKVILSFNDYLSVIYLNEKPSFRYKNRLAKKIKGANNVQTSTITMLTKNSILDPTGDIINPLDVFYEGYWSFEQFADTLPLDYQPPKD